jgi:hypothetical protein
MTKSSSDLKKVKCKIWSRTFFEKKKISSINREYHPHEDIFNVYIYFLQNAQHFSVVLYVENK